MASRHSMYGSFRETRPRPFRDRDQGTKRSTHHQVRWTINRFEPQNPHCFPAITAHGRHLLESVVKRAFDGRFRGHSTGQPALDLGAESLSNRSTKLVRRFDIWKRVVNGRPEIVHRRRREIRFKWRRHCREHTLSKLESHTQSEGEVFGVFHTASKHSLSAISLSPARESKNKRCDSRP